jgi:phospholipid/cholesterol/gamma-HCH transport system permease protein
LLFVIDSIGALSLRVAQAIANIFVDLYLSSRAAILGTKFGGGFYLGEISKQIYFTGIEALLPLSLLAVLMGLFAGFYSNSEIVFMGGERIFSRILTQITIRDIGPLIVSLLVIARSGTAIASELGGMQVNREVEALRMLCVDPHAYLVFPRICGGVFSVLGLGVCFTVVLLSTFSIATYFSSGVAPAYTLKLLLSSWDILFLTVLILKYIGPAVLIFTIACGQGLSIKRSSFEVPQVTSRAVLQSVFALVIFHVLLTTVLNFELIWEMWA